MANSTIYQLGSGRQHKTWKFHNVGEICCIQLTLWLWSCCWGIFYEIFNVLPCSGKVQEKIHKWWTQLFFCIWDNWQERQKDTATEKSNYSGCQWPSLWKLGGAFVSTLRLSSEEHSSPKSALQSKTCRRSQFTIALRMSKRGRHLVVQLWQCKYIFVVVLAIGNGSQGKWKSFWRIWDACVSTGLYFRGKVIDKA